MATLFWMFVILGALLCAICVPLIQRRIKPNLWYGFRVPKTIKNPDVWYPANEYAGRALFVVGLVVMLAASAFVLVPGITVDAYALSVAAVIAVSMTIALILSFRYLSCL